MQLNNDKISGEEWLLPNNRHSFGPPGCKLISKAFAKNITVWFIYWDDEEIRIVG